MNEKNGQKVTVDAPGTRGVELTVDGGELVIRTGAALPLEEPVKVVLHGQIDTVSLWLEKRLPDIDEARQRRCSVVVDSVAGTISLDVDETDCYGAQIVGKCEKSRELGILPINGEKLSAMALSDKVKMSRHLFESVDVAMKLVSDLRNLKAKIDTQIERSKDDRGNSAMVRRQAVDSNIPSSFTVMLELLKGEPRQSLVVEVCVDPDTLEVRLISPDLEDRLERMIDRLLADEVKKIQAIAPGIVIVMA